MPVQAPQNQVIPQQPNPIEAYTQQLFMMMIQKKERERQEKKQLEMAKVKYEWDAKKRKEDMDLRLKIAGMAADDRKAKADEAKERFKLTFDATKDWRELQLKEKEAGRVSKDVDRVRDSLHKGALLEQGEERIRQGQERIDKPPKVTYDKNLHIAAQSLGISPEKVKSGTLTKEEAIALADKYREQFGTESLLKMLLGSQVGNTPTQGPPPIKYDSTGKRIQ